jgi:type I restriction enzyme M protein
LGEVTESPTIRNHAGFIWSLADLLRGDYKQSEYGRVILPLTVLRRLDCVLEPTKEKALAEYKRWKCKVKDVDQVLFDVTGVDFYNTSPLTFRRLLDDPNNIGDQLLHYINGFSPAARDVLDKFDFRTHLRRLERSNLLYMVVGKFCDIDLHPEAVSNLEMGYLYEELVRRFSELSNETAGEHFTPREVIRLMVNLLFIEDKDLLTKRGIVKTLYDPACGTGGMLSVAETYLRELNTHAKLRVFGQELNAETFAVCRSDMMLKGQDASNIHYGNSFSEDGLADWKFDYLLANPPFGVDWKKVEGPIRREHEKDGLAGRFGAGLPRINDGSFLFLQHMISKMKPPKEGGSRLAIVFNGSPLFTGGAGSGESEIRRWIIENDWLEAVVALPEQLFYNTGISTYFWVVTNRKSERRRGQVQLVDGREFFVKMRKSLGEKRKEISAGQIAEITGLYDGFEEGERVKVFPNHAFGYQRITVERPLRVRTEVSDEALATIEATDKIPTDTRAQVVVALRPLVGAAPAVNGAAGVDRALRDLKLTTGQAKLIRAALLLRDDEASVVLDRKGDPEPDPELRDYENVALTGPVEAFDADPTERLTELGYRTAIADYMAAEVLPYVPDAWVDHSKTKVGYELPVARHFYKYIPPRPLEEIDAELRDLEAEIQKLLARVTS